MICKYCHQYLDDGSVFCSSCGKKLDDVDNNKKKYFNGVSNKLIFSVLGVVVMSAMIWIFSENSSSNKVYKEAKEVIQLNVKRPDTLKFPSVNSKDVSISENDTNKTVTVIGSCSAQNGFGAMNTINYTIEFKKTNDGRFDLVSKNIYELN